jgi:hypothetical protein
LVAVSVCPCWAVPLIVGSAVFASGMAVTTAVWLLVAEALPPEFDAVTTTRIVEPMSDGVSAYVELVAPEMSAQLAPDALQRRHWYV